MDRMFNNPILFYDGECGLCHRFVMFVLKHEKEPRIMFAPLQGETIKTYLSEADRLDLPDSIVLVTEEKDILTLSDAVIRVLKILSPGWRRVGCILEVFPKPIRDYGYKGVAAIRKKIFKKPDDACPLVAPELRKRFRQ